MSGTLFVIATPLGNLDDLSPRARSTLESVDCIACEDTRRTAGLLARFEIRTTTISCHGFNEKSRLAPLLERLAEGQSIALVSDAGTPAIADPGALLVAACASAGHLVIPIPGPSAVTALLSVAGLPADRYVFEGFLPHRGGERRRALRALVSERRPVVFFETPHRIREALQDIGNVCGNRLLVVGRELTKVHETLYRGTSAEILGKLDEAPRGEFVLMLPPGDGTSGGDEEGKRIQQHWHRALQETAGDRRAALKRAARELDIKRAELFRRLTELGESPDR